MSYFPRFSPQKRIRETNYTRNEFIEGMAFASKSCAWAKVLMHQEEYLAQGLVACVYYPNFTAGQKLFFSHKFSDKHPYLYTREHHKNQNIDSKIYTFNYLNLRTMEEWRRDGYESHQNAFGRFMNQQPPNPPQPPPSNSTKTEEKEEVKEKEKSPEKETSKKKTVSAPKTKKEKKSQKKNKRKLEKKKIRKSEKKKIGKPKKKKRKLNQKPKQQKKKKKGKSVKK